LKRALVGHHGEVAHVDLGLLDLARLLDGEAGPDPKGGRVGRVPVPALLDGELGRAELVIEEPQLEVLSGIIGDRVDLVEELPEPFGPEPVERVELSRDEIVQLDEILDAAVGAARGSLHLRDSQRKALLESKRAR
jgi:hypothetical protein